jgi:hypothetical protein
MTLTKAELDAIANLTQRIDGMASEIHNQTGAVQSLTVAYAKLQTAFESRCFLTDEKFKNQSADIEEVKAGLRGWNILNSIGVAFAAILALFLKKS